MCRPGNAHLLVELDGQVETVRCEMEALRELGRRAEIRISLEVATDGGRMREALGVAPGVQQFVARDRPDETESGYRGAASRDWSIWSNSPKLCRSGTDFRSPVLVMRATGTSTSISWRMDTTRRERAEKSGARAGRTFRAGVAWGGVITGEHGIGLAKKRWWPEATSEVAREVHRAIKDALDPKGILNPGKFLD